MREIRFRAWNKTLFIMMPYEEICAHFQVVRPVSLKEILEDNNLELMQYTGLKANGVEIYEGDIVSADGMFNDFIVFRDGGFNLNGGEFSENLLYQLECYGNVKVIGNIYQNPELLEEK